ncbi:unnamed protein product, partial [Didymodactylos carnosus]
LEDDLNRSLHYANENLSLHMFLDKLENSRKELKSEMDFCEREKFECYETISDLEVQIKTSDEERDQCIKKLIDTEYNLNKEIEIRQCLDIQLNQARTQLKD